MKHYRMLLATATVLGLSLAAQAQSQDSNSSTVKQSEVAPKNSDRKDIDEEITNKKLRAELGSKSKWSIRTAVGYQGGSIEKPFEDKRPNYRGGTGVMARVSASADVAMKYRVNDSDSLNLGTGITVVRPFHRTMREATSKNENFNISNPYLEYNKAYKAWGIQMVSSGTYTHSTESFNVDVMKNTGNISIAQTGIQEVGKASLGLSVTLAHYLYSDSGRTFFNPDSEAQEAKSDFDLGIYPFAEYSLTDDMSLRTVFGYFNYEKLKTSDSFSSSTPYQSVGLGISITRDIYLYPNVQFVPNDIRADRTNVALSANINML